MVISFQYSNELGHSDSTEMKLHTGWKKNKVKLVSIFMCWLYKLKDKRNTPEVKKNGVDFDLADTENAKKSMKNYDK